MQKFKIEFNMQADKDLVWERFGTNIDLATESFLEAVHKEYNKYPVSYRIEKIK